MRIRTILRSAVLALLLAPSLLWGQAPPDPTGTSFRAPERVAGFALGHTLRFPDPSHGVRLRYDRPGAVFLSVFLYPTPRSQECEASCDSVAVDREASGFTGVVSTLVEQGHFDALRIDSDVPLSAGPEPGALRGRHLRMSGTHRGEPRTSHFYLFGGGRWLLKVRATYPPDAAADSAVAAFVAAFAAEVQRMSAPGRSAAACALGPADDQATVMTGDFPGSSEAFAARVEPTLRGLGYVLDGSAPGKAEWTTLPRRTWPPMAAGEPWAGGEHPGLVVQVEVQPKGDRAEIQVAARALCQVKAGGKDGEGLDVGSLLEMMSAVELIHKLTAKETP